MNRSLAGDEPNLVVYYRCDEGTGLVVTDHAPAAPSANGALTVSGGLTNGPVWVLSGIQPFSPFAETLPATGTDGFINRLNGLFNPAGADTRVWFEWGITTSYGNLTSARAIGSGNGDTNWSEVLAGLENDVTYHFRAVASNSFGIVFGGDQSFTDRHRQWTGVGGDNLFSNPNNWSPAGTLHDSDTLIFPAGTDAYKDTEDTAVSAVNRIVFTGPGTARISGNALNVNAGISCGRDGLALIDLPVVIAERLDFYVDEVGTLQASGVIGGTGSLTKRGVGGLRLTASNTYTGTSCVSEGKLQVDGFQPQSRVYVNGGTLLGMGTVGHVDFGGSGQIAPGAGPGILATSNFNASAGGSGALVVELNGNTAGTQYDQLNVRGSVRLTGLTLQLSPNFSFNPTVGDTFTIINNDGLDPVTGTFPGLPQGAELNAGGKKFTVNYSGGDGNDVVLTSRASLPPQILGDFNGDGRVDQNELNTVLSNYFPNSPFFQMTNVAGLGGTNVTFALTNSLAGAFGVECTTNLLDWFFLGPATPRYEFTDTNAPAAPQRYYRLRWP
jgi:autotransporter-associated beta strand protein